MRFLMAALAGVACCALWTGESGGTTSFFLRLRPQGAIGYCASLAFDATHADSGSRNTVVLSNFTYDGRIDSVEVVGGPGYGNLLNGANPAPATTLEAQYFFNSLSVEFDSLGASTTTRMSITEVGPSGIVPDELAAYLVNRATGAALPTSDDTGANSLFVVDVTGAAGGELTVFAPMVFIAPDTLALDGAIAGVAGSDRALGRLRLSRVFPNPAVSSVRIEYAIPAPGGRVSLTVWDVSGRRVATLLDETERPGSGMVEWSLTNRRRPAPGVYWVKLEVAGQTAVRSVVLAR